MTDAPGDTFRFTPCSASEAGFAIEPLLELRTFLAAAVGNGNLPGAAILLARGDKLVLHEALGCADIGARVPLQTDSLFRIYSMTKPLTAVGMLLLYEEGRWSLDDPVSKYLPEFRDFASQPGSRASREPTVGETFTHTGGLSFGNMTDPEHVARVIARLDVENTRSLTEMVGIYASFPPQYEPGTRWEYSVGMDLQASIIERLTGQRFDRFMEQRVLRPLGMHDTGFVLSDEQRARLVPGYVMDAVTRRLRPGTAREIQDYLFPQGGTSFRSTATDFARFARMLLNRGRLGNAAILRPESVEMMLGNRLPDAVMKQKASAIHYEVGGGNGFGMNGRVCVDPAAAGRPVGKGTYEWAGAFGTWFWADPQHDILFVGMTHRLLPYPEMRPLSVVSQDLVYRALRAGEGG
jgi:CubicO group peptidase (beta-lactamase class C family)